MTEEIKTEEIKPLITKYYIDNQGNYIGGFDETIEPPQDSIEIQEPPQDARQKYNFETGFFNPFIRNYIDVRREEYNKRGATLEVLTVLIWKKLQGEDVQAQIDAIQALRQQVEELVPKN